MRKSRLATLSAMAVACLATLLGSASAAFAVEDHFCGIVLQPGNGCGNGYLNDWERVRTRYPGLQSHNVDGCVFMYNWRTLQYRGGAIYCGGTWSSPTWNPFGHNYGTTNQPDYQSWNLLPGSEAPHTLVGWTSNNQTDG